MSWKVVLKNKRKAIGMRYSVDGKTYQFSPEQVDEYKKEYNNPYLSSKDHNTKKRIALRNIVRRFGLQGK